MHEFEQYINSIISKLKVNKKKKNELAEEFMDHLKMLKIDCINSGMNEQDAINEAIKRFGGNDMLKTMLDKSILPYRTVPNIIFGILFTFLLFIVESHIPTPGIDHAKPDNNYGFSFFLAFIVQSIPLGYFLPVMFSRIKKVQNIFLSALVISPILGIVLSIHLSSLQIEFIVSSIAGGMLGSAIGFAMLTVIDKLTYRYRLS